MFSGRFKHAIDGKGRTSVPSRFREVVTSRGDTCLAITTSMERCLVAYTLDDWRAFEERLAQESSYEPAIVALRRVVLSGVEFCEFDKTGRVLLTATLRDHARLSKDAVWAGLGNKIEIWDAATFEDLRAQLVDDLATNQATAGRLAELGL